MRTKWMALVVVAGTLGSPARAEQIRIPAEFWTSRDFLNDFVGSYGFATDIEPRITAEEQKVLKDIEELVQKDPATAATRLRAAVTDQSSAALDFILGQLHLQMGNHAGAITEYKKALRKFPNFRRAEKSMAIAYIQEDKPEEAVKALTRTVELGGEDGNTYGLLGYCYLAVDKFLSAEAAYRKAMLFAPDNADWKLGLARCLLAAQRSREAVALFEELIQKDPEKADYWLLQANAFLELAEYSNAARNYEILRRMGKATGASLMALGDIYTNEDLKDLALDAYLASLQKEPNQDLKRPLQAVEIMTNRQAWDQASKLLAQINAIAKSRMKDEERRRALKLESKIALAVGDDKAAVRTLEELIRRDPLDGEAMLLLAGYYGRTGEIEHAELLYERATKLRDYEANALVLHAQLLVQQSKYEKAVRLLQQAQQIRPRENVAEYLDQVERLARASAL